MFISWRSTEREHTGNGQSGWLSDRVSDVVNGDNSWRLKAKSAARYRKSFEVILD